MHNERGSSNFKVIFALAVLAAMIYLGVKFLPPYVNNYQFQDALTSVARFSAYAQAKTEEDIRAEVIAKGKELDVLLTPEDIAVVKTGGQVNIDVKYTVRVDLPGRQVDLHFNPVAGSKVIAAK